jgi:hypothetical protein
MSTSVSMRTEFNPAAELVSIRRVEGHRCPFWFTETGEEGDFI